LAFEGDLERTRRQIEAVTYPEAELDAAVASYRKLLDSEQAQRRLLTEGLRQLLFADPPEHLGLRLEAADRLREKRPAEAAELLERAAVTTPALDGQLNGKPFTSLRDLDDLFAGVLEVMAQGHYYWVPLEQVAAVAAHPPKFPRDLLWLPARLELTVNAAGNVLLPALYPNSHEHPDMAVRLGRTTDWKGDGGPVLGSGLHTFLVDNDPVGLLKVRELYMAEKSK
jgi:type VI secretion system protein ImpE